MSKEISIRTTIPTIKKVVLLENMIFLITASPEKIIEVLEHKMKTREKESHHFELILNYVSSLNKSTRNEEINLEAWCRANDTKLSWKHIVAELLESSSCELYYKPRGIYVLEIQKETYKHEVDKPSNFFLKESIGFVGRKYFFQHDLILQVQDRAWV